MHPIEDTVPEKWSSVNLAFSKQSIHFDVDDRDNPVLQAWRMQVYNHVAPYLKPGARILELNAGTGIDAFFFANQGYSVHATDLSSGMIEQIQKKITSHRLGITCQQMSFENIDQVEQINFDYVFSNFGGLNCIADLSLVTRHLGEKLKPGAYLTWVIMPRFCPWELLWLFKGKWRGAFRRFRRGGTQAHLEGEFFKTYYHSLPDIRQALGESFKLVRSQGLGIFSPPPAAAGFYTGHPHLSRMAVEIDQVIDGIYPFNRWGDHLIVTFQFLGQ